MYTPADKKNDTDNRQQANDLPEQRISSAAMFGFSDNRPAAVLQRKLREAIDKSPRAQQTAQLQAMADRYAARQVSFQQQENRTGLPDSLKSGIEQLSGYSMNDVQVYYNSGKPAQLQAHAFAQGTAIHLAPGQEQHLPHEAWHVVQQKQNRVQPTFQLKGTISVNDNEGLEQEADAMGAKAAQLQSTEQPVLSSPVIRQAVVQGKFTGELAKLTREAIIGALRNQGYQITFTEFNKRTDVLKEYSTYDELYQLFADKKAIGAADGSAAAASPAAASPPKAASAPSPSSIVTARDAFRNPSAVMGAAASSESAMSPAMTAPSSATDKDFAPAAMASPPQQEHKEAEAASSASSMSASSSKIPTDAQKILDEYSKGGLLVHSIQLENAKFEADNLIVTIEEAVHNQDLKVGEQAAKPGQRAGHSGKRNWSIIHDQITCSPYEMGEEGKRFMAVLARMEGVANKYLEVYAKDASSNAKILKDQQLLEEKAALVKIQQVLDQLKANPKSKDNSEIQTLGIDPQALGGLVFHKVKFNQFKKVIQPQTWDEARPLFQTAINEMAARGGRSEYHIFTYRNNEAEAGPGSTLMYIDTMSAKPAK